MGSKVSQSPVGQDAIELACSVMKYFKENPAGDDYLLGCFIENAISIGAELASIDTTGSDDISANGKMMTDAFSAASQKNVRAQYYLTLLKESELYPSLPYEDWNAKLDEELRQLNLMIKTTNFMTGKRSRF